MSVFRWQLLCLIALMSSGSISGLYGYPQIPEPQSYGKAHESRDQLLSQSLSFIYERPSLPRGVDTIVNLRMVTHTPLLISDLSFASDEAGFEFAAGAPQTPFQTEQSDTITIPLKLTTAMFGRPFTFLRTRWGNHSEEIKLSVEYRETGIKIDRIDIRYDDLSEKTIGTFRLINTGQLPLPIKAIRPARGAFSPIDIPESYDDVFLESGQSQTVEFQFNGPRKSDDMVEIVVDTDWYPSQRAIIELSDPGKQIRIFRLKDDSPAEPIYQAEPGLPLNETLRICNSSTNTVSLTIFGIEVMPGDGMPALSFTDNIFPLSLAVASCIDLPLSITANAAGRKTVTLKIYTEAGTFYNESLKVDGDFSKHFARASWLRQADYRHVDYLDFAPDGGSIVYKARKSNITSPDNAALVGILEADGTVRHRIELSPYRGSNLDFTADGRRLTLASDHKRAVIVLQTWDVYSGAMIAEQEVPLTSDADHVDRQAIAYTGDGRFLLLAFGHFRGNDLDPVGWLSLLDANSRSVLSTTEIGLTVSLATAHNAALAYGNFGYLLTQKTGPGNPESVQYAGNRRLKFDEKGLASFNSDEFKKINTNLSDAEQDQSVLPVFAPDDQLLAVARGDYIAVWETQAWPEVNLSNYRRFDVRAFKVAFMPDSRHLLAADKVTKNVYVLDTETGSIVSECPTLGRNFTDVVFAPQGDGYLTLSGEGIIERFEICEPGSVENFTLRGLVFEDLDNDCIRDPGEPAVANEAVVVSQDDNVVVTAADGSFKATVPLSGYRHKIRLQASQQWLPPCGRADNALWVDLEDSAGHNAYIELPIPSPPTPRPAAELVVEPLIETGLFSIELTFRNLSANDARFRAVWLSAGGATMEIVASSSDYGASELREDGTIILQKFSDLLPWEERTVNLTVAIATETSRDEVCFDLLAKSDQPNDPLTEQCFAWPLQERNIQLDILDEGTPVRQTAVTGGDTVYFRLEALNRGHLRHKGRLEFWIDYDTSYSTAGPTLVDFNRQDRFVEHRSGGHYRLNIPRASFEPQSVVPDDRLEFVFAMPIKSGSALDEVFNTKVRMFSGTYPVLTSNDVTVVIGTGIVNPPDGSASIGIASFPNPTTGELRLRFDENVSGVARILSLHGAIHFSRELTDTREFNISTAGLAPGMYFIQFVHRDGRRSVAGFQRIQ